MSTVVQQFAAHYITNLGFEVVPLLPHTKEPGGEDRSAWMRLVFKPDDFRADSNIGLRSVRGLVVVDLDSPEAVALADEFLPDTGAVYGRPSKPRSKRLYTVTDLSLESVEVFKDRIPESEKATLLELRVNHQDMAPPSVHPDGEQLKWDGLLLEPSPVPEDMLLRSTRLLATAAVVARYYNPPGNRNEWCLALAGCLRWLGVSEDEAVRVLFNAGRHNGDQHYRERESEVRRTFAKTDDEPYTRDGKLAETIGGERGKAFIATLRKIWCVDGKDSRGFVTDSKWQVARDNQENVRLALDKLGVRLSKNVFANRELIQRNGGDAEPLDDEAINRAWLAVDSAFRFRPSLQFFETVVLDTACTNKFHPVGDYLDALRWDGVPRVDRWLATYGGAEDSAYVRAVGALVLIAAVRRVRSPGCKFDELLILESGQGLEKSNALHALCPNDAWFSDSLPLGADSKVVIERTAGVWLLEASELIGGKREVDHLKSFLSRQVDGPVRLAYGRRPVTVPRQFVVVGTTNRETYLKDLTGNRRFWPVRVKKFDVAGVLRDRDQLWAEAAQREAAGESIRLRQELWPAAEVEQEERRVEDPWEAVLEEWLGCVEGQVRSEDVWQKVGVPVERRTQDENERLGAVMRRLGFRRRKLRHGKTLLWGYRRGNETRWLFDEQEVEP